MAVTKIAKNSFQEILSIGKIFGILVLLLFGNLSYGVGPTGNYNTYSEFWTSSFAFSDFHSGNPSLQLANIDETNISPIFLSAPAADPVSQIKCVGENATFSVTGGTNNQWQESIGGTGFVDIVEQITNTLPRNSVTLSMNGNQYRCIVDGVTSAAATLTVYALPVVTSASTASICSGTSTNINLTASVPSSFTWTIGTITGSISGASAASGPTISQVLTNANNYTSGTVQYLVTPTSTTGSCAGAAYTITVTVNPTPLVTNSATASICSGSSTNLALTSSTASIYTWTVTSITGGITGASSGTGTAINQTLTNPSNSTAGTVVYSVTATSTVGTCTSAPFPITVTVHPIPIVTNSGTYTICSGAAPNIILTSSSASSYSWTVGSIVGSITGATASSGTTINQILTNPSSATAGSVIYNVTPVSAAGTCTGATFPIKITVNPAPVVSTPSTTTICSGTSPAINLSSSIPSTYTWTVGAISGSISGAADGLGPTINQTLTNPSDNSTGTVEYRVTPTSISGSCAGPVYSIIVTVNPALVVTTVNTATSCSGTSTNINLTASVASSFTWTVGSTSGGITGASSGSGNTISQTLINPSNSASGAVVYNVTPTATSGGCVGPSYPITVTVNPAPIMTNSSATTICSGTSPNIALTSSIASSFAWTVGTITGGVSGTSSGSGSTINQTLTNTSSAVVGTVEYLVIPTATTGTCAGAPFAIVVTVNPAPVVTTPNSFTTCSGTSPNIGLSASIPSSFSWTIGTNTGSITGASAGSGSTINQVLTNPSNSAAGSVEYRVTPTSSTDNCVGPTYSIIVTVNPAPLVTTANTATICSGLAPVINLAASATSSFSWTIGTIVGPITGASSGAGPTINQTLTNSNNPSASTVVYNVIATSTSSSCPSAPYPITVTVNPTPTVNNAPTASTCSGAGPNITLNASAPCGFSWTIGNITGGISGASSSSGTTINQTLTNPSHATAGTVEYIVTPTSTSGSCVGASSIITVTVYPIPEVTTPNTASTCNGTAPNVALTATAPSNFSWTIGTITGSITGASPSSGSTINQILTNPSHDTSGSVVYIVTPSTITGACAGPSYNITITVGASPILISPSSYTICSGVGPDITLDALPSSTYTWVVGTITGGITGASSGSGPTINQTLTNPSNASAGTVEYLVTPTEADFAYLTCATFSIIVTVNPKPVVTTFATASVCSGTSPNLALTSSVPSNFSWTLGTNLGTIAGANAGAGVTINDILTNPSHATVGSVAYLVTPTAISGGCVGPSYPITVSVNPGPNITTPNTATTCSGVAPAISLTASAPSTFAWTIGTINGSITGATNGSGETISQILTNPSTSASGTVEYLVTPTATTGSCVGAVYTITVTVNPTTVVTTANTATVCSGSSPNISLAASASSSFAWTVGAISGGITGATAGTGATINQTLTNPSSASAGTVEYLVTPTATTSLCAGVAYSIIVTVNPKPVITNPLVAATCSGSGPNITLAASVPSTYTWLKGAITGSITGASDGSGPTINQILGNPSNASEGTVEYIVTPTSAPGACAGTPSTITVTVGAAPVVTNAGTATTCSGTSPNIALTASSPSTFTWIVGPITGVINGASDGTGPAIDQILTNPSNTSAGTVTYFVTPTATSSFCAGAAYTIIVTVNPKPVVTSANTYTICSGTDPNISLTASVSSSFNWTISSITGGITGASAGSGTTINQILTNPGNTTSGTVRYIVTPTASTGSCAGTPFTITVTVNPIPIVTSPITASICSVNSPNISLTASAPSNFAWSVGTVTGGITGQTGSTGSTINQVLTNPNSASPGTVNYIVTPTSMTGACAGISSTITVTVHPKPVVTNANTTTICSGTSPNIPLTSSASSNFAWTIGTNTGGITGAIAGSGTAIDQILTNPSNTAAGTVQYLVTPTSVAGFCVGSPYTITVTVNPAPTITNTPALSICSGASPNITLAASAASTYSWAVGTITGNIAGASSGTGTVINQTLTNPSNLSSGTVEYLVTPTATTGSCAGSQYSIIVTVHPTVIVTSANTATICSGTGPNIALSASAPSNFSWTIGTITGGITGASASNGSTINQTLYNPNSTSSGTVQYVVTPTSTTGTCTGVPSLVTVTVNPTPVVTNPSTLGICSGNSPNIALSASVTSTFSWTVGTITGGITGAVAGSGPVIDQILTNPSSSASGTVVYLVTPTSSAGSCIGSPYTITVTVNPSPTVTNTPTSNICSGTSPNITLTSSAASTFSWTIGTTTGGITGASAGSGGAINQTLVNPSTTSAGTVEYLVTPAASSGLCPGVPYTITVTVNPMPIVTNSAIANACSGTSPNIVLTSSIPSSFAWTIGTGGIGGASASSGTSINQVLTNPSDTDPGTVPYIVTPTSTSGSCIGSPYTITVTVNPSAKILTSATSIICSGTTTNIALTSTLPSSYAWSIGANVGGITGASASSGATISQLLTNPNHTVGSVDYIVTPTSTNGSCAGVPYTIKVTVNPAPVVLTSATKTICSDTDPNISLTASVTSTFHWTVGTITGGITGASAGSGSTINQTLTNPGSAASGTIEYLVTPTASTGSCAGTPYSIIVTVNPKPIVTNAITATICSGTSPDIALASSVPSTFTWLQGAVTGSITGGSDDTGPTINQVLTNPGNVASGTVAYIVTPTSTTGSCIGTPRTITVTVNPIPTVTSANTATICSGTSPNITLAASSPSTFVWTIGTISGSVTGASAGNGTTINQILTNPSSSSQGTVEYIVTPTSEIGSCSGIPYIITVAINPAPTVTNPAAKTICNVTSTNITLTATVSSTFAWTIGTVTGGITGASPGSGGNINQTLTNPSSNATGTVQYIVTPTAATGSCAGSPYTITVTVNPTVIVTNSATASTCSGAGPNIVLTASVPSNFSWTIGTISGGITGASADSGTTINQILTNSSNTTPGTVQYIVTPRATTGSCPGAAYAITVTVNATPVVTNTATASTCSGTSPNISLTASVPSTFTWTIGSIVGSITGSSASSGSVINQTLLNPSSTASGTVTYIVTPTATTGSCPGTPYSITVTVNPSPGVTSPATVSICSGTSPNVSLTASASSTFTWTIGANIGGITGAAAGSGSTINQTLVNPSKTTLATVQYIVTPTASSGSCAGSPYTITVTVYPSPIVTNSATASTCSGIGPNITLTSSVASSFGWTIGAITGGITGASASTGTTINQTLTNPSNVTSGTVQYIVTPTSTTGSCAGTPYTITVTVQPASAVTTASTTTICSGSSSNLALTASVPSSFAWTVGTITGGVTGASAGSGATINQILTNPGNSITGSVDYIVTPTSILGNCAGSPFTVTVTVTPSPTVTTTTPLTICSGTSPNVVLASSISSVYSWTVGTITGGITGASSGSGATINQTLSNPSNNNSGTITYLVAGTSTGNSCTGAAYPITVTVTPKPIVTNAPTANICSGTSPNIVLTSSTPSTFSWTIGSITGSVTGAIASSGTAINQVLTNPSNTVLGTVTYIVTPTTTTGSCAGTPYSIVVTVSPPPVITTPNSYSSCSGESLNIQLTSSLPSNYTWTIGAITGGITGATAGSGSTINQVLTNPSSASAGSVDYIVTPTSITGSCIGASYTIAVTVNPSPAITSVNAATICSGTSPNISLTASASSSFTWTIGTITGGIIGASAGSGSTINQTLTNTSNATAGTVVYLIRATSTTNSCTSSVFSVTVTVKPVPGMVTSSTANVCSGVSSNISLTASTPSSFAWTIGTITGGITGASAGSGPSINQILLNPNNVTAGSVDYIVVPTSLSGSCVGPAYTISVIVNPTTFLTSTHSTSVCSESLFNYTPIPSAAGAICNWTRAITAGISNVAANGVGDPNEILVNTTTAPVNVVYVYTLTYGGCSTTENVVVTVNPKPKLSSTLTPVAICSNSVFNYIPSSLTGGTTYTWVRPIVIGLSNTETSGGVGTNPNETLINTTSLPVDVNYVYTLMANGCSNVQTVTVTVQPSPILTSNLFPTAICSNSAFSYIPTSSTPGTSFLWSRSSVSGILNPAASGTGNPNEILYNSTTDPISVIYAYRLSFGGCVSSVTYNVTVIVNPAPSLSSPLNPGSVCSGTVFAYPAISLTPGANITWRRSAVPGITQPFATGTGSINEYLTNSTALPINVTYNFTTTLNGCSSSQNVVVTVNPSPLLSSSLTVPPHCTGSPFSYIARSATPGATFDWTRAAVVGITEAANFGSGNINELLTNTTAGPINVTYVYTVSANGCTNPVKYSLIVAVYPIPTTPTITVTGTIPFCEGNSVTLTSSNANLYQWSNGMITKSIDVATAGSYTVITAEVPGCMSSPSLPVNVLVNPAPSSPVSGGNINQCVESVPHTLTATATVSPGCTLSWYSLPIGGTIVVPSLSSGTVATSTFYAESTNNATGCKSLFRTPVTISVVALPDPPVATSATVTACESSPLVPLIATATVPTGSTIKWYLVATGGTPVGNPTLNSVGNIDYYAETDNGTCTSLTRTKIALKIIPAPAAPTSFGSATKCAEAVVVPLTATAAATGSTISWYTSPSGGTPITGLPTLSNVGTITYYAEAKDPATGCLSLTRSAPVVLTINATPAQPTTLKAQDRICQDATTSTLTATAIATGGANVVWYNAPSGGSLVPSATLNGPGSVTYWAEAVLGTCSSRSPRTTSVVLTIDPAPAAPVSLGNITECEVSPIQTLTALSSDPAALWYTTSSGGYPVTPTWNSVGSVTYYAESVLGSCPSIARSAGVVLTIKAVPAAPVVPAEPLIECEKSPMQTLTATATAPAGSTVKWYATPTGGIAVASPTLNSIKSVTYYAESDNGNCKSLTRTPFTLQILAAPKAPTAGLNVTECEVVPQIQTLTASASFPSGTTISWFATPTGGDPVGTPYLDQVGTVTYYAEAKATNSCTSVVRSAPVVLTINPTPKAPVTIDVTECAKKPLQVLTASVIPPVDGATISWYNDLQGGTTVSSPTLLTIGSRSYYAESKLGKCINPNRTKATLTIKNVVADPILKVKGQDSIVSCESSPLVPLNAKDLFAPVKDVAIVCFNAATGGSEVSSILDFQGSVTLYAAAKDTIAGCTSFNRIKVRLVIHAAPPAPVSSGNIIECVQSPTIQKLDANKSITPPAGMKVVWYDSATNGKVVTSPTLNVVKDTIFYAAYKNNVSNCEGPRTAVTLTISDPPVSRPFANSPVGLGQTIHLNGNPKVTGYSYLWTAPNGNSYTPADGNVDISNATGSDGGWYKLKVTNTIPGCSSTDSVKVVVMAATAGAQKVCMGGTLVLIGQPDGMSSYSWSGPNIDGPSGFSSSVQNPFIDNITSANEGLYTLTVTDSKGVQSSSVVNVTITPLPPVFAKANSPVCQTGSLQLEGGPDGMFSYSWRGPNNYSSAEQKPVAINPPVPGDYVLTVVDIALNGCSASDTVKVEILKPNISYDPLCLGATLHLRGEPNGMMAYKWSGPNGFFSNLQFPTISNVTAANLGTYKLEVTDQSGCTPPAVTKVVTMNNPPNAKVTLGLNPACEGSNVSLQGDPTGVTETYQYAWTGPNGFVSSDQNPPDLVGVKAINAGYYAIKVTNAAGCTSADSSKLDVIGVKFGSKYGPYCKDDSKVAISATPAGVTFSGTGIGGGGGSAWTFDPKLAGIGTHLITYSYTGSGCSIVGTLDINVVGSPTLMVTNPTLPSCSGTTADLTDPKWTDGSTPGLIFTYWKDAKATSPVASPASVAAGLYFIKGATQSGKCFDIQPVMVSQPDSLRATLTQLAALNCAGDTTGVLDVKVTMGTAPFTYFWSTVPTQTTATATGLPSGIYTVVVTDAKSCTSAFTGEIKEPAPIKLSFATKPIQCLSDANGSARVDSINGSSDVNILNSYKYLWNTLPPQTTREAVRLTAWWHKVTLTSPNGCVQKDSVFIDVLDTILPTIVCPKDIEMTVSYIKSPDGSPNKYVVDLGKPFTLDNCQVDTLTNDAPAKFRKGTTYVVWTVTDQVGLVDTCTQKVYIKEIPTIPQLISPNGDGVNDTFVIDGLNSIEYSGSQMTVFTRSGQLVFQSSSYELPENAWDGRYAESSFNKNKLVAPGVYYYILKLGGTGGQTLKGYIYVYY